MDQYLRIATDGSGDVRGTKSSWAWVAEDGRYKTGNLYNFSNNQAELKAIEEALFLEENLVIISDSNYAIRVLINPKTKVKKNVETINRIKNRLAQREKAGLKTQFVHQYSHTIKRKSTITDINVILNHLADTLCTKMRELKIKDPSKITIREGIQKKLQRNYNHPNYSIYETDRENLSLDSLIELEEKMRRKNRKIK